MNHTDPVSNGKMLLLTVNNCLRVISVPLWQA
jgi:hypothetical protein